MMLFIQEVFSLYIEFPHAEVKIEGMEHIEVPGMLHIRQRILPGSWNHYHSRICAENALRLRLAAAASHI